jgi:hypothetical protein
MGYVLLWIESLAAALLLAAAATAALTRLESTARYYANFGMAVVLMAASTWSGVALAVRYCMRSLNQSDLHPSLLIVGGLIVATGLVCFVVRRWFLEILAGLLALAPGAVATTYAYDLRVCGVRPDCLFYMLSWSLACLIGLVGLFLLVRRWRRERDANLPLRPWRRVTRLLLGCAGAVAAFVVTWLSATVAVERRVADACERARTIVRERDTSRVPAEQNAALVYKRIDQELREVLNANEDRHLYHPYGYLLAATDPGCDPGADDRAIRLLGKTESLRNSFRQASRMAGYRDLDSEWDVFYGGYRWRGFSHIVYLQVLSARWHAKNGRAEEALADLAAIRDMARLMARPWDVCAIETAPMIEDLYTWALEDVMNTLGWRGRSFAFEKGTASSSWARFPTLVRCMKGPFLEALSSGDYQDYYRDNLLRNALLKLVFIPAEMDAFERLEAEILRHVEGPYHEEIDALMMLKKQAMKRPLDVFASQYAYMVIEILSRLAVTEARSRARDVALAAAEYWSREGHCPESLEALLSAFPGSLNVTDPYSGKPLRWISSDKGPVIYSVGVNLQDDGGIERNRGEWHRNLDILFCLGTAYQALRLGKNVPWPPPAVANPPKK